MSRAILTRLVFDAATLVLLLLSLAYWWLGNGAHEIFGTAMFVLLFRHVVLNRRWFATLRRGRYDGPRRARLVLNLSLAGAMIVLLLTSLAISRSMFAFLPIPDYFVLREIHWFSAYWVVVVVGVHIGLHWHIVAGHLRASCPALATRPISLVFSVLAIVIAALGANSSVVLGLGTRLQFEYSMVMWDFTASTMPYFLHWLAVIVLYAALAHFGVRLHLGLRRLRQTHTRQDGSSRT